MVVEHFYHNNYVVIDVIVEFERVYMVDESKFSNKTYDDLLRIYEKLPSYMGKQADFPCWFGKC